MAGSVKLTGPKPVQNHPLGRQLAEADTIRQGHGETKSSTTGPTLHNTEGKCRGLGEGSGNIKTHPGCCTEGSTEITPLVCSSYNREGNLGRTKKYCIQPQVPLALLMPGKQCPWIILGDLCNVQQQGRAQCCCVTTWGWLVREQHVVTELPAGQESTGRSPHSRNQRQKCCLSTPPSPPPSSSPNRTHNKIKDAAS